MLMISCIALAALAGNIISEGFWVQGIVALSFSIIFGIAGVYKQKGETNVSS